MRIDVGAVPQVLYLRLRRIFMASSELNIPSLPASVVQSSGLPTGRSQKNRQMEKRWIWPFELEEQIGSGAMGLVYRARFVKNDRRVALKLLPEEVASNAILASRFQREMEILKDLRHPHIVHCFGGTCEGDQWFYAMELIEGGTLGGLLSEQGKLPWRQVVEFGQQVCAALDYAHDRGVIHRDLKPGNLLLTRNGKVKLADFGLALVAAETRLTSTGKTMGSLHYMSPEQIQGKPALSNRTDLYALGCVLFELLCGRTPFVGQAMAEILQQHIRQPPPAISSFAVECPVELETLIAQLLKKDPDERPQTAQAVGVRLRSINEDVTVRAPRANRFTKNLAAQSVVSSTGGETIAAVVAPSGRTWNGLLVAGLLVALAAIAWLFTSRSRQEQAYAQTERLFVAAIKDPSQPALVRIFSAKSLGEIGSHAQTALEPLLECMHDPDALVRVEIARSIGKIGSGDAYLIANLRKIQERDDQPEVRAAISDAMDSLKKKPSGGSMLPYIIAVGGLVVFAGAGYWVWKQAQEAQSIPVRG
jgi:serine/threonine-protein kinase